MHDTVYDSVCMQYGDGALYWEDRRLEVPVGNVASDEVTAVIHGEATWRRVKRFVAFLHIGNECYAMMMMMMMMISLLYV